MAYSRHACLFLAAAALCVTCQARAACPAGSLSPAVDTSGRCWCAVNTSTCHHPARYSYYKNGTQNALRNQDTSSCVARHPLDLSWDIYNYKGMGGNGSAFFEPQSCRTCRCVAFVPCPPGMSSPRLAPVPTPPSTAPTRTCANSTINSALILSDYCYNL